MVGHTHEDVDQMFSRFNEGLRAYRGIMYTLSEFITTLEDSFTPKPSVFFLYGVRDWKSWLDTASSHVYANTPLHGQLRPHQFKFLYTFASDKHAEMKYKRWARDEEWFPYHFLYHKQKAGLHGGVTARHGAGLLLQRRA